MQPSNIEEVLDRLKPFMGGTGGFDSWLTGNSSQAVLNRLGELRASALSCSQLNQLLALAHLPELATGAFRYYWLSTPAHCYDVTQLPHYHPNYTTADRIISVDQLAWGLYRFYFDSLLFFGTLSNGYRELRSKPYEYLDSFFQSKRYPGDQMIHRGTALELEGISQDDRYLIAEQACKSFEPSAGETDMLMVLKGAWQEHKLKGGGKVKTRDLLQSAYVMDGFLQRQGQFIFAADELLDSEISTEENLIARYHEVLNVFTGARKAALRNTELYLSMANLTGSQN